MATTEAKTAHTPGPWTLPFVTERPIAQEIFGPDERIALVELPGNSRHAEQVANARLMAAAPELLEACKAIAYAVVRADVNLNYVGEGLSDAMDQVEAAIAKATT